VPPEASNVVFERGIRHAQHTARGPNVAHESFQFGPQSPNLPIICLIFDGNHIKIGKNLTNLALECLSNTFFWPAMKFELCILGINDTRY